MLTVTKERLINVAINGFLMSQKFLMLQRRSTLMCQKTENVNVAKINYFNVEPTKTIFTMSQIRNFSKMFQKQVMKYVRNSEFSRLGVSYLTSKIYCKCNYCSYDFTVLNLVLTMKKVIGNWKEQLTTIRTTLGWHTDSSLAIYDRAKVNAHHYS